MKHITILLVLFFTFSAYCGSFPDYRGLVNDFEDVLTEKQEKSLSKLLTKTETNQKVKIILVSTQSFAPAKTYQKYILGLFEYWKMNVSNTKKGILILVSKKQKTLKIIPGTEMRVIFNEAKIKSVLENVMVPKIVKEKHFTALKKGIKSLVKTIKAYNKVK